MDEANRHAWIELALRGVPQQALVALLHAFGSPRAILEARPAQRMAVADAEAAFARPTPPALDSTLQWLDSPGHDILTWDDPRYPGSLLELGHAPPLLYMIGHASVLERPALAIVGSRNPTPQGQDNARAFARALSHAGVAIVSGLAAGIDGAAHEGGLEGVGSTIAVTGTGLDRVYPARHRDLAHAIAARGLLLSEFPPGTPVRDYHFPRRNRLISGLARGVLVVEAALQSGSLITARLAGEQGREVFAIPGSIHSPLSKGCHKLIREGAKLVETAEDILTELRLGPPGQAGPALQSTAPAPMCPNAVLAALGEDPADLDALIARTGKSAADVAAALGELEVAGEVRALPGGRWQRHHS